MKFVKSIFIYLLVITVFTLVTFTLISLCTGEFNPRAWSDTQCCFFGLISIVGGNVAGIMAFGACMEDKI